LKAILQVYKNRIQMISSIVSKEVTLLNLSK